MKVTDGVYAYLWTNMMENNCNTYVLQGENLILIDPGLKHHVPGILEGMKKDGLNPDDIALIINTHSHPDHIDGVGYFAGNGPQITLHEEEQKFLNDVGKDFFKMFGLEQPSFEVDFYMTEGDLNVGDISLQVYHTPGHSPGSVCLHWPEKQVLVSGDVVFSGSVGRTDFPGGSGEQLKQSIEKISSLSSQHLLPGHNELVQGADEIKNNFNFIRRAFFSML